MLVIKLKHRNKKGLVLWELMNEPEFRVATARDFMQGIVDVLRPLTTKPFTVGVASYTDLAENGVFGDFIKKEADVLTFHTYHMTYSVGVQILDTVIDVARRFGKPVFNSETGCIARANPYDLVIKLQHEKKMGYVLWELMISDCTDCYDTRRWKHGFVYPNGNIRDSRVVAAINGW